MTNREPWRVSTKNGLDSGFESFSLTRSISESAQNSPPEPDVRSLKVNPSVSDTQNPHSNHEER